MSLTSREVDDFITNGFLRIDGAFSKAVAAEARDILWRETGCDPQDPQTWTRPVIWLGEHAEPPFQQAVHAPAVINACDALVGPGRWLPRRSLGTFPVRFPSAEATGDDGWHVDASFPGAAPESYLDWRINHRSRGRALLMLFLFSDVGERDAPTRLRTGSHRDVARLLRPAGEEGMAFMELAAALDELPPHREELATGDAGTVYLCHPFLVHAAQRHRGTRPRFMAQPPLLPAEDLRIDGPSPVEQAMRGGNGVTS